MVVEASDQHKVVATYMSDIYTVFAILYMMQIGIWIYHHTATVTFVSIGFVKSADNLGVKVTGEQKPCHYAVVEASDQHRVVATFMLDIYEVFAIIHMIWIGMPVRHHHTATVTFVWCCCHAVMVDFMIKSRLSHPCQIYSMIFAFLF